MGAGEEENYLIISIVHFTSVYFLGLCRHHVIKPFYMQ